MIYPLMVQSLQKTGFFHAVMSSTYSLGADYRLDTQLLSLEQNFIKKPSVLEFSAKVVLTNITDNKVIASRIINQQIPCPSDTPYGGVIAANKATRQFTEIMTGFVVSHLK
jgi:cholesterol transport system auxiliary component